MQFAIKTETKSIWHRLFIACLSCPVVPLPQCESALGVLFLKRRTIRSHFQEGLNFVASITCHSGQNFNYISTGTCTSLWSHLFVKTQFQKYSRVVVVVVVAIQTPIFRSLSLCRLGIERFNKIRLTTTHTHSHTNIHTE